MTRPVSSSLSPVAVRYSVPPISPLPLALFPIQELCNLAHHARIPSHPPSLYSLLVFVSLPLSSFLSLSLSLKLLSLSVFLSLSVLHLTCHHTDSLASISLLSIVRLDSCRS